MVQFCPNCENMLRNRKEEDGKIFLICPSCGYKLEVSRERETKKPLPYQKRNLIKKTVILEDINIVENPTTEVLCPKCGYTKAEYFQQQTRSADEPPTTFFRCLKCDHRWREY
ncbi:MAG: transcription factor S [Candidatus Lokiarchaeota archaeon]|nr:transcription factor S [Candidatus Lokiarchaeota archaeon]